MSPVTSPPLVWQLAYRLLGLRVPDEYKPWVAHDVTTRTYVWWRTARTLLWGAALVGLFALAWHAVYRWPARATFIRGGCFVVAYALLASGKSLVRRELRWQGIDRHGRPTSRKPHPLSGNAEAVLAALVAMLLFTGGTAAVGYGLRPEGPRCAKPSDALLDRIKAGLNRTDATFMEVRSAKYSGGEIIAGALRAPSTDAQRKYDQAFEIWVVQGNLIYSYGHTKEVPGWTNFPPPPSLDRVAPQALQQAVNCVTAAVRP
jgi:hypothetical protein